jgi:SAM-dependent methyltransferase
MIENSDAGTLAFYDSNAGAYAESTSGEIDRDYLDAFMAKLPENGSVCDLGSGSGWASAEMRDAGFDVTAIDGSTGLAAEAKKRYNLDVQVMRFEDFAYENTFDGLWAAWSLHHSPRQSLPELLQRVGKSVRPGGVLYLSMKGGSGEDRDTLDRLYSYHEMDELLSLIDERIGGEVLKQDTWDGKGFDGTPSPMHALILRKSL